MAIKMTKKEYEQKYGERIEATSTKKENIFSSAFKGGVEQTKQGYQQAKHAKNPLELLRGGTKLAAGAINTALSPLAPITAPIGAGIEAISNKISDNPSVQKFAQTGAGQAVAQGAEDVANLATITSAVAGGVPLAKGAGVVAGEVGGALTRGTGRVLKKAGEGAYGLTVTPEESTSIALRKYKAKYPDVASRVKATLTGEELEGKPTTEANTAARMGMMGTEKELGVQATRFADEIFKDKVIPSLEKVKGKVNMKSFFSEIEKEINKTGDLHRKNALKEGLNALKDDFKNVSSVSLRKLQDYKSDWGKSLPQSYFKGKDISGAMGAVKALARKKAQQIIYKHTDAKEAYLDYGNLQSIMEAADKATKDPASRTLGRNIWEFIMDKAVTPIATTSGKILYKTGEGLEFVGQKGAKKVGDIVEKDIPYF